MRLVGLPGGHGRMIDGRDLDLSGATRCPSPETVSAKNSALTAVKGFHSPGMSSSVKIAVTGQTGSHAAQSMHSSGWM